MNQNHLYYPYTIGQSPPQKHAFETDCKNKTIF